MRYKVTVTEILPPAAPNTTGEGILGETIFQTVVDFRPNLVKLSEVLKPPRVRSGKSKKLVAGVMLARRVTKVAYDGKRVKVHFQIPRAGVDDPDEFTFVCNDKPEPTLQVALEALRVHVRAICQLPEAYCAMLEIRGASYGYGGADAVMGATITALKHLPTARAPLVLNTPYLASAPLSATDDAPLLSPAAKQALDELAAQALRYVDGEREQGDLFKPLTSEPVAPAVVEAFAQMAPPPGSGVDSITLSTDIGGEHSEVTLHQGDGEKIRRGLAIVHGDQS